VASDKPLVDPSLEDASMARELRRTYHDRIADLRAKTIAIIRDAARATADATDVLLDKDSTARKLITMEAADTASRVAEVETEVLALLALQAPVARDLRVILTSRDIAQIGALCLGLCRTLATREGRAHEVLSPELRALVNQIGEETAELLRRANGAWSGLDLDQATAVVVRSAGARQVQRRFLAELVGLRDVPVDAAVDLGMAVRVYERLTDHAVDIARRVLFVVTGISPGQASTEAAD
jgi:phosphate transport system protein